MFSFINKIKKAAEAKLTECKNVALAAQIAANVSFEYSEFCQVVNDCLEEQHPQGWEVKVARMGHIMTSKEVKDGLLKRAGILGRLPWVKKKIESVAKECDGIPQNGFFGETTTTEQGSSDCVVLYYSTFADKWWTLGLLDWREAVRQIIRHEFRHVRQIIELRRRGGSCYVQKALEAHMRVNMFNYKKDPMEEDAYANQAFPPSDQSEIGPAVDKIVANF